MADPKPLASLTAGLLARKGQAKPAMRPGGAQANGHDDLGWNDMGTDHRAVAAPLPPAAPMPEVLRQQAEVVREFGTRAKSPVEFAKPQVQPDVSVTEPEPAPIVAPVAEVAPVEVAPVEFLPIVKAGSAVNPVSRARGLDAGKAKAAFTLRLDADRHLRLRLACAVSHRSAQQIVTEALDALLSTRPDIDALAETLPARRAADKI